MANNRRFGWHSGTMSCKNARILGDLTIQDTLIFGDVSFGALAVKGRMSSGTKAGSAIDIDANYAYGQGHEFRWTISSWSGTGNSFDGQYIRAQSDIDNASGTMHGIQVFSVANASGIADLQGAFVQAYVKGDSTDTVGQAYGIHGEFSMDGIRSNTITLTTEVAAIFGRILSGKVNDYTKIHGQILRFGDMDGGSRTYGNGILIEDDAGTSGTSVLTTGLNISLACTTGITLSGAVTTGIDFTATTLALDSSRTNSAIAIGDRLGAKTITMAAATNHLDPVQINLSIAGVDPTAGSTINGIYQLITHGGATNMPGLRLKCADWNVVVKRNIQDAYVYQGEIDYTTNSVTVGGETAVMSLNMNCDSTVTGDVRGLIVNIYGTGLANASSIGIEVRTDGGSATLDEGIRIWSVGANTITAGLLFAGTVTYFADFDNTAGAENTAYEADANAATTIAGKVMINTSAGAKGYINVYSTPN